MGILKTFVYGTMCLFVIIEDEWKLDLWTWYNNSALSVIQKYHFMPQLRNNVMKFIAIKWQKWQISIIKAEKQRPGICSENGEQSHCSDKEITGWHAQLENNSLVKSGVAWDKWVQSKVLLPLSHQLLVSLKHNVT